MKHISKIAAVFAAVIFAMAFAGCAAPDALSDSTYEYSSSELTYTFNFERGGRFKLIQAGYGNAVTISGNYSVAGSEATLKQDCTGTYYNLSTSDGWETFKWNNLTFRRK